MVLNYIWIAFFIIAFVLGLVRLIFFGDTEIFPAMMNSTFDMAKSGFEISLYLTGAMTLWMGMMSVGEKGGIVSLMARVVGPLFRSPRHDGRDLENIWCRFICRQAFLHLPVCCRHDILYSRLVLQSYLPSVLTKTPVECAFPAVTRYK